MIKNLYILTLLFAVNQGFAQDPLVRTSATLENIDYSDRPVMSGERAGTCASPDGSATVTAVAPPDYAWLQANGYCNPASYGEPVTTCWSFTSGSTSITINSGVSSSGCTTTSYSGFTLYECDPSCAVVGTGLTYTGLTYPTCYTWCFTASGTSPFCEFNDFCPYYFNNSMLPIGVLAVAGYEENNENWIRWSSIDESNIDHYEIEHSFDGENWQNVAIVSATGYSEDAIDYVWKQAIPRITINYYRLKSVDLDNNFQYHGIVNIDNRPKEKPELDKITNLMGQEVQEDYDGIKLYIFSDGTVQKTIER